MTFGECLTYIRIKERKTRWDVADATGIPLSALREYEQGPREPRWSRALEMFHALGYEVVIKKKGERE